MSLQVNVNIVKGWPSASVVEKSLSAAVAVAQGDIVYISSAGQWEKAAASAAKEAKGSKPMNAMEACKNN